MKLRNIFSLFFTKLMNEFHYPYCPVWDKALDNLLDKGTLIDVKNGLALFEHNTRLYEVYVGSGFDHFGHLVALNSRVFDENVMRRPSCRVMDKLQRRVAAEVDRITQEKEKEMQEMFRPLLTE